MKGGHHMNKMLQYQLSKDYCCTPEEVSGRENIFTVYSPLEERRKFGENSECFLKICAVNGKLLHRQGGYNFCLPGKIREV